MKYEGVSQSDRDVRFANTLARMLKERFPDKELYVQLHAYGLARNPPLGIAPDDNVIISSVANFHMRSPEARKLPMQQHAAWAKTAKHLMWRPNLGSQAGLSWGMPDVAMTQAGEDFRFVADKHCLGLFFDLFWFHWATQGPHYYALAHLAWNPHADVGAVMDDYYQRGFGPAAADLKAYWELLERTRMEFVAEEPSRQRAYDLPKKYTPELLARRSLISTPRRGRSPVPTRNIAAGCISPNAASITRSLSWTPARGCRSSRPAKARTPTRRPKCLPTGSASKR